MAIPSLIDFSVPAQKTSAPPSRDFASRPAQINMGLGRIARFNPTQEIDRPNKGRAGA
jgi:hypothetical protein